MSVFLILFISNPGKLIFFLGSADVIGILILKGS